MAGPDHLSSKRSDVFYQILDYSKRLQGDKNPSPGWWQSASSCTIEMKPSFASGVDPRISAAELAAMVSGSHMNPRCTLYTTDIQRSKKWTEK